MRVCPLVVFACHGAWVTAGYQFPPGPHSKSIWVKRIWVYGWKGYMGEKSIGEKSVGEKYMGEKSVYIYIYIYVCYN